MVYLFLADGFEEVEALTQVDYLRRAGVDITTVGVTGEYVTGTRKIIVKADKKICEVYKNDNIDMLILPGGLGGVNNMHESFEVMSMLKRAYKENKYICAICAAPTILAKEGMLEGVRCICYPDMTDILSQNGAIVENAPVVMDKNIITSKSAGTAEQFALFLIEVLCGKQMSDKIKADIYAR